MSHQLGTFMEQGLKHVAPSRDAARRFRRNTVFPLVERSCFLWKDETRGSLKARTKAYYLCIPEPHTAQHPLGSQYTCVF